MADYTFLTLSPTEFEQLTRDLLQRKLHKHLESFTSGRDKGIDCRHCHDRKGTTIIQCKRYPDFASLKKDLPKEADKVAMLKPARYIFVTSAGLTPDNKDYIKGLFAPYIRTTGDILGRDDLNNLLAKYPKIEEQHYKLWLSSTPILQKVLKARLVNQSQIERQNIEDALKTYAENKSYIEAMNILSNRHFVIITGIPGIGKTTLARMLVYGLLGKSNFEEFVYVSGNIKEAYDMLDDETRQVFLFDDFLGKNFLDAKLERNEEKTLLDFIKHVERSPNKRLILTTREYILQHALGIHEKIRHSGIAKEKYLIDLSKYTKLVRAQILYNHLFFANLPATHLAALIDSGMYREVIVHENYNPRIIEAVLQQRIWEGMPPKKFPAAFLSNLDNPEHVWQTAFEKQISPVSQMLLLVLLTTGTPITLQDLKRATKAYASHIGQPCDGMQFNEAVKDLDGTFIRTKVYGRGKDIVVEYHNPSIRDFLLHYYEQQSDELTPIIESAPFMNQFTELFTARKGGDTQWVQGRIRLSPVQQALMADRLVSSFDALDWSGMIAKVAWSGGMHVVMVPHAPSGLSRLARFVDSVELRSNSAVDGFIFNYFENELAREDADVNIVPSGVTLIEYFKAKLDSEHIKRLMFRLLAHVTTLDDLDTFEELEDHSPGVFTAVIQHDLFKEKIEEVLDFEEDRSFDDDDLNRLLERSEELSAKYPIRLEHFQEAIRQKLIPDPEDDEDEEEDEKEEQEKPQQKRPASVRRLKPRPVQNVNKLIDSMFDSLRPSV